MPRKRNDVENVSLFDGLDSNYKIPTNKRIKILSFFSGVGFQELGIKKAFPDAESYKTCEWAVPSIIGYDAIWNGEQDKKCYTTDKQMLIDKLYKLGISLDYDKPAELKQIQRLSLEKLNQINQAIERCHNLVNIMNVKGGDLEIVDTDKNEYILFYSFPCQDLSLRCLLG